MAKHVVGCRRILSRLFACVHYSDSACSLLAALFFAPLMVVSCLVGSDRMLSSELEALCDTALYKFTLALTLTTIHVS